MIAQVEWREWVPGEMWKGRYRGAILTVMRSDSTGKFFGHAHFDDKRSLTNSFRNTADEGKAAACAAADFLLAKP